MMETLARATGLDDDQAQTLREHHGDCTQTSAELFGTSRSLEGGLGYLLYAIAEFSSVEEMLEDRQFQQIMFRWSFVRIRKEDEEHVRRTILPTVNTTTNKIIQGWESEADEFTRPFLESKPNLYQIINRLARALMVKRALEHLRFELLGRNSFGEQEPHPHANCLAGVRESGSVKPFRSKFEEGLGYRPRDRQ